MVESELDYSKTDYKGDLVIGLTIWDQMAAEIIAFAAVTVLAFVVSLLYAFFFSTDVHCPKCKNRIVVYPHMKGKVLSCQKCGLKVSSDPAAANVFQCPHCRTRVQVKSASRGKVVRCPKCQRGIQIPE